MRALIESGADVNKARNNGVTPLFMAAEKGHGAILRVLIEADADVIKGKTMYDGATPLCIGAQKGHEAVVRALIEAGTDVNKTMDDGVTPLYIAAHNGHAAVVRALIELGADVIRATDDGATALFMAAQMGHEAVVRALIEVGADVNRAADNGWSLEVQAERLRRGSGFGVKALKSEDIRVVARALRGIGQDNSGKLYRAHRIAALASSMSLEAQAEQLDVEVRINDTRLLP